MRVLFDYQIFYLQKFGGISNYFYNIIKNFDYEKNEFQVFAPLYINEYIKHLPKNIVNGYNLNLNVLNLNLLINQFFYNYKIKNFNPDIVHLTYYNINSPKIEKTKYILTVYDMIHEQFSNNFINNETSENKKNACEYADHIICISQNTKMKLIEIFKIPENKISVIYLGADHLDNISSTTRIIDKKYILYVGNRKGYKNFNNFIKAYSLNRKISDEFDIIVFGGEKIDRNTKNFLKSSNVDINKITFLSGHETILKNLYENASLFIYPSFEEGFGIAPLEAMSCGCPVISSNISVLKEVLGNSCEYFNPNNVEEISYLMEKIIYNEELNKKLSSSGLKRKEVFSWKKCSDQTLEKYNEIFQN